jgi:UDP-2,3-diacylglucosamine pyrophosphatase LpxH
MKEFAASLDGLYLNAENRALGPRDKWVFISDLHLGDGSKSDDSLPAAALVERALGAFYFPEGYSLVLNGDIEELQKFPYPDIRRAHASLYRAFDAFNQKGRLAKIVGNHDLAMLLEPDGPYALYHALRLNHPQGQLLAYHGHQASTFFVRYNYLSRFLVRYLAQPLKIKNPSVPMTSRRRFKAERRVYRASQRLGIASITGHTHRPLFESMSRKDFLRFSLEGLIARYAANPEPSLREEISRYSEELRRVMRKRKNEKPRSLYEADGLLVPCLFNSGCALSKKGFTAIEIEEDAISLVFWEIKRESHKDQELPPRLEGPALSRQEITRGLEDSGACLVRSVLRREALATVFSKIKLLGAEQNE